MKKVGHKEKEKVKKEIQEQYKIMGNELEQYQVSEADFPDDVIRCFITKPDKRRIEL